MHYEHKSAELATLALTWRLQSSPSACTAPSPPPPTAMQGVWASKYNERALLSMRKVGLDFRDLRMAVLVQRVVPAAYAFVIHTHNPSTGSPDEVRASPHCKRCVIWQPEAPADKLERLY